tara:strand:+ start:134 stop:349 length:216 start_codon:yes stop_codon:yes gene_type:complete
MLLKEFNEGLNMTIEYGKLLTKLLVVKREITKSQYDSQSIINGNAVEVLDECIDTVEKAFRLREEFESECG